MTQSQKEESLQLGVDGKLFDVVMFQIQKLQGLVQLADSKAQFILAGNTILISVTVVLFSDIRNTLLMKGMPLLLLYIGMLIIFIAATLISMIQAFLVVYPRYSPFTKESSHASLLYFREIAHIYKNADEYNQVLLAASPEEILRSAGSEIYGISVDADKKYNLLNRSIRWLIAGVISWIFLIIGTLLFTL